MEVIPNLLNCEMIYLIIKFDFLIGIDICSSIGPFSFHFILFRSVTFRFILVNFVSFHFACFVLYFISHFTGTLFYRNIVYFIIFKWNFELHLYFKYSYLNQCNIHFVSIFLSACKYKDILHDYFPLKSRKGLFPRGPQDRGK